MVNQEAEAGKKPGSWALKAGLALAALGLLGFLYAVSAALSKPQGDGYGRFATGALQNLRTLDRPPPQSVRTFITADGTETKLAAFRGQVLVVNLWATWCAPCVEEMPTLGALQRRFAGQNVKVLPISVDRPADKARAIRDLARLSGGSLTFYHDPTAGIAYEIGAGAGLPMTIIYAKDGREIARLAGIANWDSPESRALVAAALAD